MTDNKDETNENQMQCSDFQTYSYKDIANYFINRYIDTGNPITHMKLQKLIYFANGIFLASNGIPLIREKFQAWRYGPVINELFQNLKCYNSNGITEVIALASETKFTKDVYEVLESVDNIFGQMDAWELSELSHIKEGAWDKAPYVNAELNNCDIESEFKSFHIPALMGNARE